jgi:hypothetical protein
MDPLVAITPSANLCKVLHNFVNICIRKQNFAELTPVHLRDAVEPLLGRQAASVKILAGLAPNFPSLWALAGSSRGPALDAFALWLSR